MNEGRQRGQKLNERIVALLREVTRMPDMLFVMNRGAGVVEAWVSPGQTKVMAQNDWVAVESRRWHCHLNLSEIASIRFVEEADVHDLRRRAFSIRLFPQQGKPILMIFFCKMYDRKGVLSTKRVSRFRALMEEYGQ